MKSFFHKNILPVAKKRYVQILFVLFILAGAVFGWYRSIPFPSIDDGYLPEDVRKVSSKAPFTIHFSQPMDSESVQAHFSIKPALEGSFHWVNAETLEFVPAKTLEKETEYQILIGGEAKSRYRKPLGVAYKLRFVVTGPPFVKFISPYLEKKAADETTPEISATEGEAPAKPPSDLLIIRPDQPVTVMFDRPLRALTTFDESLNSQEFPPLEIQPPVKGVYRWVGTSAFQFVPSEWTMGTLYTLTLPAGIRALDGGVTEQEIVWQLATESLRVVSSYPYTGSDTFSVNDSMTITFNQPMELDYIQPGKNVLLYPSNDLDADKKKPREDGFFNMSAVYQLKEDKTTDKTTLVFKPEFPYQYDTDYKMVIQAGLHGAAYKLGQGYGERTLAEDYALSFHTVRKPGIVSSQPGNGQRNYKENAVYINFASPMTEELVKEHISLEPKPEADPSIFVSEYYENNRTVWRASISYDLLPSKDYVFQFKGPFKDSLGNESRDSLKTVFTTAPRDPFLTLLTANNYGLFTQGLDPIYGIKSVNIQTLDLSFCALSEEKFMAVSRNYAWYDFHCAEGRKKTIHPEGKLNQMAFQELNLKTIFEQEPEQGIYFMELSSPEYIDEYTKLPRRFYQVFFISDTNLTLKKSGQDLLVWATDLKTGQPVSRMELSVRSSDGKKLQQGVTDGKGVYKITKSFEDDLYVFGSKNLEGEKRWSLVNQYWNNGIQSWQYQTGDAEWIGNGDPRVYLYTDRPLYRAGDDVLFKGIYRMDFDARLKMPEEKTIRLVLEDPEYNEIDKKEVGILPDGSFNGSFHLGPEARLGQYNLYADVTPGADFKGGQRFYHYFFVQEYVKPKFEVEILGAKTDYLLGDTIEASAQANYYFGGAIMGGKVRWNLMRDAYFFDRFSSPGEYYQFGSWGGFRCWWDFCRSESSVIAQGEDVLDGNGRVKLKIKTEPEKESLNPSALYTLTVDIENQDGEHVAKKETFIVHQGSYYIGLSPRQYLAEPGKSFEFKLITVSADGKKISGKKVNLELYREVWNTVKKQGVDGAFYDENVRELKLVNDKTVTSAEEPMDVTFDISADAEGGQYFVQAKGADSMNTIFTEAGFYVTSSAGASWPVSNNNQMELAADQPEYYVGGKARILIKSPYGSKENPVKALITYERNTIQRYDVIDIVSGSDTLEVPITEEMLPNVYISVMAVKGAGSLFDAYVNQESKMLQNEKKLSLTAEVRILQEDIAEIKAKEQEKADKRNQILISKKELQLKKLQEDLQVLDEPAVENISENTPAKSTINFSLIKPDFKLGIVNLPVSKRERAITVNLKTSQPDYQPGEPVEIEIHTLDYQNRPISSLVSLAVVDESLLALKANRKISPLDYFYVSRALQVSTASNLTFHTDRVNLSAQKGAKGGGGGGQEEGFDKKRGEFKDTAYFNPLIQTDQGGYAKVTFDPPDNLTTWQMWAVASAGADQFGMAKEDFVVKKRLSVSPVLPRFAVSGDTLTVGALIHNQSDHDLTAKAQMKAPGALFRRSAKTSVQVLSGATERVDWVVDIKPLARDTVLTFELSVQEEDGTLRDTAEYSIPALTFAFPEIVAANGIVKDLQEEGVQLPSSIVPDMGALDLRLGGSLLPQLLGKFKALEDYPYGCAEQITSQILASLVLFHQSNQSQTDLFKFLNLDIEKNRKIITDTLQKISKFQRSDGGYGFWEGSEGSYPMLTAYILFAQHLARESGFTVSEKVFDPAIQYLWGRLNSPSSDFYFSDNDRAFVLWALSEAKQNDTGMTVALFEKREGLTLYARALLLMNFNNLLESGQKSVRAFMEKLKAEIVSYQIVQDRSIHFEEKGNDWGYLSTDLRTTAMVLMALNRDSAENPILPNVVNYLTAWKPKGYLLNTQETAWTLLALLEYADSQDILEPDFTFTAKLNGDKISEGKVTPDNLNAAFEKQILVETLKKENQLNTLTFTKEGEGQLLFDMELKYFLPNELIWPVEKGFQISRNYYEFDTGAKNKPAKTFKSGQIYRGELSILVPEDMHYVVAEERLPAGFEAINFDLETADASLRSKLDQETMPDEGYYWYDNALWYFNHKEVRNDRVLLFADYLPKGVYTYSFLVRAGLPGKYHHLPASAHQMYFPEVFGRTGGEFTEVTE